VRLIPGRFNAFSFSMAKQLLPLGWGCFVCIQLFEVPQMITLIIVVLVLMLFTDGFRAPEPHYRYGYGALGLILLILLFCMLLGLLPGLR
jgi:hypothetical protein